jgi:DNA-binding CsgD family transcriptional regulator
LIHAGPLEGMAELYAERLAAIDPFRPLVEAAPEGSWLTSHRALEPSFLQRDPFWNEYFRARGLHYVAAMPLARDGQSVAFIGVHRSESGGPFEHDDLGALDRLVPHLQRSARIAVRSRRRRVEEQKRALEIAGVPALGLDRRGRVVWVTASASAIVAQQDGLEIDAGRLAAQNRPADEAIGEAIRSIGADLATGGPASVHVPRPSGARAYALLLAPIGQEEAAPILAAIVDFAARDPTFAPRLERLFGLSRAEAEVAALLASGVRPAAIARERRVSITTVRAQIRSIVEKTATDGLSEFITMVARLPSIGAS